MNPLARLRLISRSSQARQTALTSLVTYAGMGLSVLSAPVVAQTLGADGRGVLAGTFVVVQVIGWVAFLGLPNGLALQVLFSHVRTIEAQGVSPPLERCASDRRSR